MPRLEPLERRETPNSLYHPLFASAFLSLDPLDAPVSIVPGDGSGSDQGGGDGGSGGGSGSQGGAGGSSPPPSNYTPADPAAAAATINQNADLFDAGLGDDASNFASLIAAAVACLGQSGGTAGVGAAAVVGLATPAAPPTSPAPPSDAATGPAPALYPPAGTTGAIGQSLSPSQFGLSPFTLLNGATVSALTPFAVSSGMSVPAAHSGGGTTITTGTDANNIGYTATTTDSWSFNATLTADAAGGLTYEETYSFSYDVQTVPAATGGASVHDWGASGYTFIANNDNGQYSFTLTAALTADEVGSQTVATSSSGGPASTLTTTWQSESQYERTITDATNPATGAASGSDLGGGMTTQSSSSVGTYSRPIAVGFGSGTVSGSQSASSGQGASYQFAVQESQDATGAITQSGTWADASGGYSGDWYSGSGAYATVSPAGSAGTPASADATPVPTVSGGPYAPGATLTGGGVYTESGADSMGYGSSDQYALQNDGTWQASSGVGSSSGTGWTQNSWSGSGGYGYAMDGGSVSGAWQQSGGAETNYQTNTNSTLGSSGWTQTGSYASGDAGGQADSYQGSGSYVINSAAASASGSGSGSGSSSPAPPAVDASPVPSASGGGPYASGAIFTGTGVVEESESDSSGYADNSNYSLASNGSWQSGSGSGWSSASGSTQWSYSASGGYGYAIAGGSVSGLWQQSGSASTSFNTNTNSTLGASGWTQTGSAASADGGMESDSYQGSGSYVISSAAAAGTAPPAVSASVLPSASGCPAAPGASISGTGLVTESGSDDSGYGDGSQYTLASGSWQQTTGTSWSSGSGAAKWGYSASGNYGYAIAGGAVSGLWQQSGSADTDYSTAVNSTLGSNGSWTTTGSKANGESGGQAIGYSGSGNYAIVAAVGAASMSGSGFGRGVGFGRLELRLRDAIEHRQQRRLVAGHRQRRDQRDRVQPVGLFRRGRLHAGLGRRLAAGDLARVRRRFGRLHGRDDLHAQCQRLVDHDRRRQQQRFGQRLVGILGIGFVFLVHQHRRLPKRL
ncbi:MAG TPA: hypothetical protein VMS17_27245 [Gemmataceae bacterium]|nr:hypothetical protein [Gemmataceae bacterium]